MNEGSESFGALSPETKVVIAGRPATTPDAPVSPAIELSSTFHAGGEIGYGRYGNQTWSALESAISALEGGKTLIFSSGMAAINAVFSLLPIGSVVLASHNGYTGTMNTIKRLVESGNIEIRYVDIADTAAVIAQLPGASLLWIESPTNPSLQVADLPEIIKGAKSLGVGVAVDNTFATPINQQPLALGADMVIHSVTKYLAGHSDVLIGSVSTNDPALFKRIEDIRKIGGAIAGPFEAWLALRGMRTLALRVEKSQVNAMEIAKRLLTHPAVENVRYPGLPTDPYHQRAKSFMKGFGGVVSFDVKAGPAAADRVCAASKIVIFATSLGGVESLWERRHRWASESPSISKSLIRLSLGCENVEDLWRDIDQALRVSLL